MLYDVFDDNHSRARNDSHHHISMEPYGWRWMRVGGADNTLDRSDLDIEPMSRK